MPADPAAAKALFLEAAAIDDPAARADLVVERCGEDAELLARVNALLAANDRALANAGTASVGGAELTADYPGRDEKAGTLIAGKYTLVEPIGEGGMGSVWRAKQTEPVKRFVAVKLIKAGMDTKQVLARFEAERQALALMDHPNIAKVLDGGLHEQRPFFVMELVKGVPITEYCDKCKLTPKERLELFVPVCQAIQHAHQKGVIHRDIKPSNVLIALYDDKPVVKVIDFGVAKATGGTLTEKTIDTGFGGVVGTPQYMSPEQATFNNLDIDTRSDVYALGVLLYELLTGSPPFSKKELETRGLLEMLRVVREEEPPRPSTRLSTADALPTLSANRGTEPKKLTGLLRNELDWIVMRALEKDRSRRYETANGFAADVQRYLAGEAVQAHPPSASYRLRKFARKHRVGLTTIAAFAGLLFAAAGISSMLAMKARRAEATSEVKRLEAEANAKDAQENLEWSEANSRALNETSVQLQERTVTSHIRNLGLQVDLDLAEARVNPRTSLLRLAHPLQDTWEMTQYGPNSIGQTHARINRDYSPLRELREFVTAAVLAAGQDFALLLPPITHDGQQVIFASLNPDNKTLLTLGKDFTARLWDTRTALPIAVLRKGDERVVNCGFSPDGRTVFTDDQSSVARFWEVPTGRFRTATEARQNRYDVPDWWLFGDNSDRSVMPKASQISASRLLTRRRVGKESKVKGATPDLSWEGPAELWDSATGRLVAQLDGPNRNVERLQFLGDGQWVTAVEGNSTVLVFSAEDGRLLARLKHPKAQRVERMAAGPSGQWLATLARVSNDLSSPEWYSFALRVWDAGNWQAEPVTTLLSCPGWFNVRFLLDDAFGGHESVIALGHGDGMGVIPDGWTVYRSGQKEPIAEILSRPEWPDLFARVGDLVHGGEGRVYDTRTWKRLLPPPGRKFHPDLARFAPDGRFIVAAINAEQVVIDTRTDKAIATSSEWRYLPDFGRIAAETSNYGTSIRLIPSTSRLDLPADLLELWAQVAARGEIGADGQFIKWNEQTWERKRQQLAAMPSPSPGLPFPGYVAADKLHWLRAEFREANTDVDKLRIARELLRRAEAAGDRAEAVRWRAEVERSAAEMGPAREP